MNVMINIKSVVVMLFIAGFVPVFAMENKQETKTRVMPVRAVVTEAIKKRREAQACAMETVPKKRKNSVATEEVKKNIVKKAVEEPQREILMYPRKAKLHAGEQWMKDNDVTRSGNIFFVPKGFDVTLIHEKLVPLRCDDSSVFKVT